MRLGTINPRAKLTLAELELRTRDHLSNLDKCKERKFDELYSLNDPVLVAQQLFNDILFESPNLIPISSEDNYSEDNLGIIFCHGHSHMLPGIPQFIDPNTKWLLVDIRPKSNPDIIADYKSIEALQYLGFNKYKYTLNHHCPTYENMVEFFIYVYNNRSLLKSGGLMIILDGASMIGYFLVRKYPGEYIESIFKNLLIFIANRCGYSSVNLVDNMGNPVSFLSGKISEYGDYLPTFNAYLVITV